MQYAPRTLAIRFTNETATFDSFDLAVEKELDTLTIVFKRDFHMSLLQTMDGFGCLTHVPAEFFPRIGRQAGVKRVEDSARGIDDADLGKRCYARI